MRKSSKSSSSSGESHRPEEKKIRTPNEIEYARHLLRKVVLNVCKERSSDSISSSSLETLVDVSELYLMQLCLLLKRAAELTSSAPIETSSSSLSLTSSSSSSSSILAKQWSFFHPASSTA